MKARVLTALWITMIVMYLERVSMSFAAPAIMSSLSMTPSTFGVVLSSFGIGYIIAMIPGGLIADKWGVRPALIFGTFSWGILSGLTGFASTLVAFVTTRLCLGLAEGVVAPCIYKTIGDTFETKHRAGAIALVLTAVMLGPAFSGPVVSAIVTTYSWQASFLILAVPAFLGAYLNFVLLPKRQRVSPQTPLKRGSFLPVLGRPELWIVSLSNFATDIAQWGFFAWMPSYLALERHIDLKAVGWFGGMPYVAGLFGMILFGWLGSSRLHVYRPQIVAAAYVAAGVSLFAAYEATSLPMAIAGLCSAGFFMFGAVPPKGAIVIELAPEEHRAGFVGVNNTAGQLGGAAAPAIIGFMVGATGTFAMGFTLMSVALIAASVCMLALMPFLSKARQVATAAP